MQKKQAEIATPEQKRADDVKARILEEKTSSKYSLKLGIALHPTNTISVFEKTSESF